MASNNRYAGLVFTLLVMGNSLAEDWEFTPRLSSGIVYTDNVNREPPGEEESDLVFTLTPGFSASRQARRLKLDLDYALQSRFSLIQQDRRNVNHELRGTATAELYQDRLFLDADTTVTQAALSANERSKSATVFENERTEAGTYSLSPYWLSNLGDYAQSEVRYRYSDVFYGAGAASDSRLHEVIVGLNSGPRFSFLTWAVDYSGEQQDREQGDSSRRERVQGQFSYLFTREWALLGRGGYVSDDLAAEDDQGNALSSRDTNNGSYWSLGLGWRPSRYLEADALYGPDDSTFRVRFAPTARTTLEAQRSDREVGSNAGARWFGSLIHRSRLSTWSLRYSEETTNVQRLLASRPAFDEDGEPVTQPLPSFSLTDEEFVQRLLQASVDYSPGRTRLSLRAFYEDRQFLGEGEDELIYGGDIVLSRRLAARTNARLLFGWDHTEAEGESDEWRTVAGITRRFTRDLIGSADYSYYHQTADEADNEYRENRISVRLTITF